MPLYVPINPNDLRAGSAYLGVTGNFTSDANAAAADISAGKTAYANGVKITGTAIPANYASGSGMSKNFSSPINTVSGTSVNRPGAIVTGLGFAPKIVRITRSANTQHQLVFIVNAGEVLETLGDADNTRYNFRVYANSWLSADSSGFYLFIPGTTVANAAFTWEAWG